MLKTEGHIIFDCDGTLISSLEAGFLGFVKLVKKRLKKEISISEVRSLYTPDTPKMLEKTGFDIKCDQDVTDILREWGEIVSGPEYKYALFDGIKELIEELINKNYKLYVWTGRDRRSTIEILKQLGILSVFEELRCADDTIPKPHPMGIEELVGEFSKEKVIVIGDSYTDIMGANQYGCQSIGAAWGKGTDEAELERRGATYIVHSPKECIKIIENNI